MARIKQLASSKNGIPVYVDLDKSHAATHINAEPKLLELVNEILPTVELSGEVIAQEFDMKRIVGDTILADTNENDKTFYAIRKNRATYSRFVKDKLPQPTQFITLILKKRDNQWELWSTWLGKLSPPFPGGEDEEPNSREFWSNHALIWGYEEIIPGTETTQRPW